jgi:hypothetical protein
MDRVPRIPGLERLKPLSQGTHATIYEATQTSVGRLVAVKVDRYRLVALVWRAIRDCGPRPRSYVTFWPRSAAGPSGLHRLPARGDR